MTHVKHGLYMYHPPYFLNHDILTCLNFCPLYTPSKVGVQFRDISGHLNIEISESLIQGNGPKVLFFVSSINSGLNPFV